MQPRGAQRGAGPWRQGADTCVFTPPLACKEDPTHTRPRAEMYVSRVTTPDDRAYEIEDLLRQKFNPLVQNGWVTAFTKKCRPYYAEEDLTPAPDFKASSHGACFRKIRVNNTDAFRQINLVSERQGDSMLDMIYEARTDSTTGKTKYYMRPKIDPKTAVDEFQKAFSAAIALVPDSGPWVIHTDLHSGNILRNKANTAFVLHDWGRVSLQRLPRRDAWKGVLPDSRSDCR